MFFDAYEINKAIEMYLKLNDSKSILWNKKVQQSSLEQKILFLVSLETNQDRYRTQVELPFIDEAAKKQIADRLFTRLQHTENAQVGCSISFAEKKDGPSLFNAGGFADVVKDDIVYELKFVSELTHEHFLQCACYIVALKLEKGILWNTRDNTSYKIRIPDKKRFLDAVSNTITKHMITSYYQPKSIIPKSAEELAGEISKCTVGVKVNHTTFGEGIIIKTDTESNGNHFIDVKFDKSGTRKFRLEYALNGNMLSIVSDQGNAKAESIELNPKKDPKQERYENGYEDVKDLFIQQTRIIRDRYKTRWVKCEKCDKIKQDVEFATYGGHRHVNLGICRDCSRKQG